MVIMLHARAHVLPCGECDHLLAAFELARQHVADIAQMERLTEAKQNQLRLQPSVQIRDEDRNPLRELRTVRLDHGKRKQNQQRG
ncbi:hypothetical protein UB46_20605 [Burkholderiaceae bacterium 16]|nr:hypothetical protein UB46_20605 [Burkholderiaceae bacterium 16]